MSLQLAETSRGLANLGNTCSINTLIQCLGHCVEFRNMLLTTSIFHKKTNRIFSIGEELTLIWKQLWIDHNHLSPSRFLKALQEVLGDYYQVGREQLDFTEVWMLLIQNLLEESHSVSFISAIQNPHHYENEILNYLYKKTTIEWKKHTHESNSPLLDLIQGIQVQQIECKNCHEFYHNLEPFQFTYLDFSKNNNSTSVSLEECFHNLFNIDSVEGWKCDKCKHSENEKVLRFWKLPKLWVLILKRFDDTRKIHTPIKYPPIFNTPNGFEMGYPQKSRYELKSVAQHFGSLNGGHYNAICKNSKNEWNEYDDIRIQAIENVFQENPYAYALFYERMDG